MSKDIGVPEGWSKSTPPPQEAETQWVSIERLLDEYTIPVLAEAVDKLDVLTHDETGRRILATNGDSSDIHSKAFAISHLANRYSILQDPGPDDDLFYQKLELEGSPLDLFGWPKASLPDLSSINPHHSSKIKSTAPLETSGNWKKQAQEIAQVFIDKNRENDLHPSLEDTANHVAKELRQLGIYGAQLKPMSSASVKRQALQGEWWGKRNTQK